MRHLFSIIILLFFTTIGHTQSPWTQEKGGGFAQLALGAIPTYSDFFSTGIGSRISNRDYSELGIQAYAEYGLLDGTTIVGSIPLKFLHAGDKVTTVGITEEDNLVAPGNLKLAVRQRIYSDGITVAGQLGVEVPIGSYDDDSGLRTSYDAWTVTPLVSVGTGFGKGYAYAYGGVGIRTNDYSYNFVGGMEGGYKVLKPLYTMLFLDINRSFYNGTRVESGANLDSGFYVNNQEWVSLGLKLLFEINSNMGVTASSTLIAFAANQVPQSPSVSIGFYSKWKGKEEAVPSE